MARVFPHRKLCCVYVGGTFSLTCLICPIHACSVVFVYFESLLHVHEANGWRQFQVSMFLCHFRLTMCRMCLVFPLRLVNVFNNWHLLKSIMVLVLGFGEIKHQGDIYFGVCGKTHPVCI